jgi:hypothetical protein
VGVKKYSEAYLRQVMNSAQEMRKHAYQRAVKQKVALDLAKYEERVRLQEAANTAAETPQILNVNEVKNG